MNTKKRGKGKYDKKTHKALVKLVSNSVFIGTAAQTVGISRITLYMWLTRGRAGEEPYASLFRDLEKARSVSEAKLVSTIKRAAPKNWRAAAWLLENTYRGFSKERAGEELTDEELHKRLLNAGYAPLSLPKETQREKNRKSNAKDKA